MAEAGAAVPIVVLTQADRSARGLADALAESMPAGTEIQRWPLTAMTPIAPPALGPVLDDLDAYRWVFLPSPATIEIFAELLAARGLGLPPDVRFGLTGPGSAAVFQRCFGASRQAVTPLRPPFDAEHLIPVLERADPQGAGGRALVLGALGPGPDWLARVGRVAASVDFLPIFRTEPLAPPASAADALRQWLQAGRDLHWIAGASGQVDDLARWLLANDLAAALAAPIHVPHARIARRAATAGFQRAVVFDDRASLAIELQSTGLPTPAADADGGPVDRHEPQESSILANERPSDERPSEQRGGDERPPGESPGGARVVSDAKVIEPSPVVTDARRGGGWYPLALLALVIGLALVGWWYAQQQFLAAERESARRLAEADARSQRLEAQLKAVQDMQAQLVARSGKLEARIAESADQQEQLTTLYDEIARSRGDGAMAEVEQLVLAATQNLQLTGNVQAALIALQNAERRIGSGDQADAIGIRRLIAQDIERLKSLPVIDLAASAGRLDEIIGRVDRLGLLADVSEQLPDAPVRKPDTARPVATAPATDPASRPADAPPAAAGAAPAATAPVAPAAEPSAFERLAAATRRFGTQGFDAVRDEFRGLVTIRRVDRPDALLLSPAQKQVARDNVRLQLLNARLNLLNREQGLFRHDLGRAIEILERWFDGESREVKTALSTLRELQGQPLTMQYPDLAESLGAIRAARAASEKKR